MTFGTAWSLRLRAGLRQQLICQPEGDRDSDSAIDLVPLVGAEVSQWMQTGFRVRESR